LGVAGGGLLRANLFFKYSYQIQWLTSLVKIDRDLFANWQTFCLMFSCKMKSPWTMGQHNPGTRTTIQEGRFASRHIAQSGMDYFICNPYPAVRQLLSP
jgi:hypothetical protein